MAVGKKALLVVYWLHTRGFSFDRPLGLEKVAHTTSKPRATIIKHYAYKVFNLIYTSISA